MACRGLSREIQYDVTEIKHDVKALKQGKKWIFMPLSSLQA
jgi:hypothetical protein